MWQGITTHLLRRRFHLHILYILLVAFRARRTSGMGLPRRIILPMDLPPFAEGVPPRRLILWVGAGFSYPAPSALPLGVPLTSFAQRRCCGESVAARI
jgi:hypothetical protein